MKANKSFYVWTFKLCYIIQIMNMQMHKYEIFKWVCEYSNASKNIQIHVKNIQMIIWNEYSKANRIPHLSI